MFWLWILIKNIMHGFFEMSASELEK